MSLRARLLLFITGAVAAVVIVLSALELNSLVMTLLEHSLERSTATAQLIKTQVMMRTQNLPENRRPQSGSIEDLKVAWRRSIENDKEFAEMLSATLAQTRSIVEIAVADDLNLVIASSNPARVGRLLETKLPLRRLIELGPFDRLAVILEGRQDYENRVVLGIAGQSQPIFTVQVLSSSVLLREALLPEIRRAAAVSLSALLVSLAVAFSIAHLVLRPLRRISRTIDQIASGDVADGSGQSSSTREFRLVEQKLHLLGAQVRDTQQGATQLRGSVEKLMEGIEEAILLFDTNGKSLISTPAAERLLGVPREEIAARRLVELFPPESDAGKVIEHALANREPLRNTPVDWTRSGERATILLDVEVLPSAVLLRLHDPEGRRAVEAQLNLSSRLTAINRLTGGVAHAIKNPLNSIALRMELLRSRVLADIPGAESEIEVITAEIARLDKVVRTFLDFTRPVDLKYAPFDLAETTNGILDLVRPEAQQCGISMETDRPGAPVLICGDRDLMRQAVLNIVRNALDAMPDGGRLSVKIGMRDDDVNLAISDTGPGIPAESRDRIFELYFSTKDKGSGIGLAMTYRAVQLHGGSIDVESEPGKGTTFRIRVPAAPEGMVAQ